MQHTAILLAAGYSSRMGDLKALLPWEGLTLLEFQVRELLKTSIDNIIVVVGYKADRIQRVIDHYPVQIIFNPAYAFGKTTSIKAGIQHWTDSGSYLIVSVDNPVDSNIIQNMLDLLEHTKSKIVIPVYSGKRGHPILLEGSLKNDILSITEEKFGLKELLRKYQSSTCEFQVDKESVLYNFNTKKEYLTIKDKFERRQQT